jgi:DNA polymerase III delta prime subunit
MNVVNTILQIPVGKYKIKENVLNEDFVKKAKQILDDKIIGMENVKEEILDFLCKLISSNHKGVVLGLEGPPGIGKCLGENTPVLLYDGSIKMVQDITPEDVLMGPDNKPREIVSTTQGKETMYKIIDTCNNESYIVNESHILSLYDKKDTKIKNLEIREYLNLPDRDKVSLYGYRVPILFESQESNALYTVYNLEYILGTKLYNLTNIPKNLLINSLHNRITLMRYIISNIGYCFDKTYEIFVYHKEQSFIDDVKYLGRSIGFSVKQEDNTTKNGLFKVKLTNHSLYSFLNNSKTIFNIDNYKYLQTKYITNKIEVIKLEESNYYGFELTGDRLFVLGDFTVTHNTRICRALGEILDLPFNQISMGGMNDAHTLIGHSSTYIGSKPGKVVNMMIKSKCMNPIIYLDECFPYNQHVVVENGLMKIGDIYKKFKEDNKDCPKIKTYNKNTNKFEFIDLDFESNDGTKSQISFTTTENHPFLTVLGYKPAGMLLMSDRILSENGTTYRLTDRKITNLDTPMDLYDISIEDNHNFIIKHNTSENGIIVHNCDKISESKQNEIDGVLTHLLDEEQNQDFYDQFLDDFPLNLSKVFFILSFNDSEKINPIVKNRIKVIKVSPPSKADKKKILKTIFIPDYMKQLFISKYKIEISDENMNLIINLFEKEQGMRKIKKFIETILNKINIQ